MRQSRSIPRSVFLLPLTLSLLTPPDLWAQTLFGPKSYTLTSSSPQTFTALVSTSAGPAYLHLTNGNPDGSARLRDAKITLNGSEIVSSHDLGDHVPLVDKPVTLLSTNLLTVTLSGPQNGTLSVTLERRSASLTSVTPTSGRQGETLTVSIIGSNTHFVQGTTQLWAGPGISVGGAAPGTFGSVTVQDLTHLTATLTIAPTTVLGPRTLLAKTNGEKAALFQGFTVLAGTPAIAGTTVTTLAGSGTAGSTDGSPTTAQFRLPFDVAPRADGSSVVADTGNSKLRQIAPDGTVSTVSLPVTLLLPAGVTMDASGRTIIADTARCVIRIVNSDNTVTTIGSGTCGFADGAAGSARFKFPRDVVSDSTGNLYVADTGNFRVRKIDPQGNVTTLAGTGAFGSSDGPATSATFGLLAGIAVASDGTVLVSDAVFHKLRKIAPDGTVTTVAGTGVAGFADGAATSTQFAFPTGLTRDATGNLYITDTLNNLIRRLTPAGVVETIAGTGARGSQDGAGSQATFSLPLGVGLAPASPNKVFVVDTFNHKIRVIQVVPPPTVTALNPTAGVHGDTLTLTVTGTHLTGATAVSFLQNGTPDPAIAATNLTANADGTQLTATVNIALTAALGARVITVTTAGGTSSSTASAANTFTVLGRLTLIPDFQILKVGRTGGLTVTLSTAAPAGGLTVTLTSAAPGITTVTSPVTIAAGATSGIATVTAVAPGTTNLTASAPGFASGLAVVTVVSNRPPTLTPIGNQTAPLGQTLTFTVTGSDPDGDAITFGVTPLPLPAHASFDRVSGRFTFTPAADQVGTFALTFSVSDGTATASETITITVPAPAPGDLTGVRGRVYNLNNTPLGNVTVTLKSTGQTAFTGTDGFFTLTGIPPGRQVLLVNGRQANLGTFAILAVPVDLIEGVLTHLASPITLPDVDLLAEVPVNPTATTVISNPLVPGVQVTIPAGTARNPDGTLFTGKLSINPVPDYGRPESRPEELRPGMAITLQPAGVRFNPPAPITFPNADSMPPGSELNLWSLSPDTGTFILVGRGAVTADGREIVTVEGGIRASAWHFFLPPQPSGDSQENNESSDKCHCELPSSSTTGARGGALVVTHTLAGVRSLGVNRLLTLRYTSTHANPRPIVVSHTTLSRAAALPPKVSLKLTVGGVEQPGALFTTTTGLSEILDETIRQAVQFDATSLSHGRYPYRLTHTSHYVNSSISSFVDGRVIVNNWRTSPFGAGWVLEGLQRIHFNQDGSLLLTETDGSAAIFEPASSTTFLSPSGDFSSLVKNVDGSFTRTLKDGTKIHFTSQGLQTSVVDRNGNTTRYTYNAEGTLATITDPAGLLTTFSYTGGKLSSITDPAGRVTQFTVDAQGDLTQIRDPDSAVTTYTYDGQHLLITQTNPRNIATSYQYNFTGRIRRSVLPDGSTRLHNPSVTVGLFDPASGQGTPTTPAPVVRPAEAVSTSTDGNGHITRHRTNKFGAVTAQTDALGRITLIDRAADNNGTLQSGTTFASGRVGQAFSFDGVDDFVSVPDATSLKPSRLTIDAWVRGSVLPSIHYFVVAKSGPVGLNGYELSITPAGRARFTVLTGNSTVFGDAFGTTNVLDRTFHHIAGTYDGSTVKVYVDGVLQGSSSFSSPIVYTPDPLFIGKRQFAFGDFFSGVIDEVAIYDRALTPTEIRGIFLTGSTGSRATPPPGLISWWPGEGDANNVVAASHFNPIKITRPNGSVVTMAYDARGNLLTSTEQAIAATTIFSYEPAFNQVTSITDPQGNRTSLTYDSRGNPTTITDALGNVTTLTSDTRGLLTSTRDALGNTTSFTYDAKGNLLTTTDPLGRVTSLTYDAAGNVTASTNALGRITRYTYDPLNRLTTVTDAAGGITRYAYDPKGNRTRVIDAKGQTTTLNYDPMDRLISATNPLGLSETFTYDVNGNLISTTNRNGQTITFDYDAANQLIKKTLPSNQVTTFNYDPVGNLISVIDPDSSLSLTYDLANRLTSTTSSSPSMPAQTISYTYDLNGNRISMTDPTGLTTHTYDALNRSTSITNNRGLTTTFTYDVLGRRTVLSLPNGTRATYTYNVASQHTELLHTSGTSTLSRFAYTYDATRNQSTKTTLQGVSSYDYDTLNRLTRALQPDPIDPLRQLTESFTYDPVGNRINSSQNGASTFNQANQLLEDVTSTYSYDNSGNLVRKTNKVTGDITTYEYDAENRLVRVVMPGRTVNYRYDGLGRRVEKEITEASVTTVRRYIYDSEDILLELDGSNNIVARYTHGPGIDEPLIMEKAGASFFYHADGLGSTTEITDTSGAIKERYIYSSFGKIESQLDLSFVQPYTFTARELDSETGLYYYRARYYDPSTGRFLQEDPISLQSGDVNFYTYVENNPLRWIDPDGLLTRPVTPGPVRPPDAGASQGGACGVRRTRDGRNYPHTGVDLLAPTSNPVVAPIPGAVSRSGNEGILICTTEGTLCCDGKVRPKLICYRLVHISPSATSGRVREGQVVGTIRGQTNPDVPPHVHVEYYESTCEGMKRSCPNF